jgi:glycine cleavage system regulatory protein
MDTHLVIAVIGRDRPGLVSAVSEVVTAGGGNWTNTHMASMSGQFAGILDVAVSAAKVDALVAALKSLEAQGLKLIIERAGDTAAAAGKSMALDLIGADRPGIVRDLSRVLAGLGVSITELETERGAGSFSGEPMFKARARLQLPADLGEDKLRAAIESLANEMMVDLDLAA